MILGDYDYIQGQLDVVDICFFRDKKVEVDHVWVKATAVSEVVLFLHAHGFDTDVIGAPLGHTADSAKKYLTKRIESDWRS